MSNELRIAMLGPKGVGKTSLLASVYDQFDTAVKNINLTLTPDANTSSRLQLRLAELKSMVNEFTPKGGIGGSSETYEFIFDLGMVGKNPELRLIFTDFPGGYIEQCPDKVQGYIDKADVILLAIDAPAMMEAKDVKGEPKPGRWHESINNPVAITSLFKRVIQNLTKKTKLLLLVPVKCETYVQSDSDASKMLATIKEGGYKTLLQLVCSDNFSSQIAIAITPVQTLGVVRFSRIAETEEGQPQFFFRKIAPGSSYAPQDVEEILRYVLGFSIKKYLDKMPWWEKWFKFTGPFKDAVSRMARDRKESSKGFEILQGRDLLKLPG